MTTASCFRDALLMWVGAMVGGLGIFITLASITATGPAASLLLKLIMTSVGILLAVGGQKIFAKGFGP